MTTNRAGVAPAGDDSGDRGRRTDARPRRRGGGQTKPTPPVALHPVAPVADMPGADHQARPSGQALDVPPTGPAPPALKPVEGELLKKRPEPADKELNGVLLLIWRVWNSLEWSKAGPAVALILAAGLAVSMVLGTLAYVLIGISPWVAAGSGVVAGSGAAAGAYRYARRRRGSGGPPDPTA